MTRLTTLTFAVLFASAASAQANEKLRGLRAYSVEIDTTKVPSQIDVSGFKTTMELELRRSGIALVPNDSLDIRVARIRISVQALVTETIAGSPSEYSFSLSTRVYRWMTNATPDAMINWAQVWEQSGLGVASTEHLREFTRDPIAAHARELANDILATREKWPR